MAGRSGVVEGRYTAEFPEGTVIFLIGMRINRLRAVRDWLPVFRAMPKMLAELYRQPERGFLGAQGWFGGRNVMVQQYWASMDHLLAYAHDRDAEHLPAWREFNRRVGRGNPTVGIWHEAHALRPAESHVIYHHMPPFGLAAAAAARQAEDAAPD
jgi:hypothetical protein